MKPTKFSIVAVVINPNNSTEVLAVKRPVDDDSLPNVWGLPTITPKDGELPESAVKRLGIEKLATEIEAISYIGIKDIDRSTYNLILMDIETRLTGKEPSVKDAITTGTKYADQQWTSDYTILKKLLVRDLYALEFFLNQKESHGNNHAR